MIEIWREIPGYPYNQISNLGRVKSKQRIVITSHGKKYPVKEKILKGAFDKENGWVVGMTNASGRKNVGESIARLLLIAFDRPPEPGEVARHLDDNKYNQSSSNLAWGTVKDNCADAFRNGKKTKLQGSASNFSKLNEEQVLEIRNLYRPRHHNFGMCGLAQRYNVCVGTISFIVKRITWKHI